MIVGRRHDALLPQVHLTLLLGDLGESADRLVGWRARLADIVSVIGRVAQVLGVQADARAEGTRTRQLLLGLGDAPRARVLAVRQPVRAAAVVEVDELALHGQLPVGPIGFQVPLIAQLDIRRLVVPAAELDEAPTFLAVLTVAAMIALHALP